jgi:hypothetical protein
MRHWVYLDDQAKPDKGEQEIAIASDAASVFPRNAWVFFQPRRDACPAKGFSNNE